MPAIDTDTFWAAFAALITFAGFLGSVWVAVIVFLRGRKSRRLQAILVKERKFYEEQARRLTPKPISFPEDSAIDRYLDAIDRGLLALTKLPDDQRDKAKEKVRELISQLRATHTTLVKELTPFTTNDAKKFFDEFDKFNQDFGALYRTDNIPHDARTHCDDVVQIVNDLVVRLESDTPSEQVNAIREIAWSMKYADEELIVPLMIHILSKTEVELSLINAAIRDGDHYKAIWLKERYRFDIDNLYRRLNEALTKMSALVSKL